MASDKKDNIKAEKNNWYNDRYEFVCVQRNIFALVSVLSLLASIVATFVVFQLAPLKSVEPFVIQVDQKSGMTQVVDPLKARDITGNESVNQYFIVQYCRARESFMGTPDRNYYNYNLVRVLSDMDIFRAYQREIALSNPDSPGARLGAFGSREIHVASIKFLDKRSVSGGTEARRYLVKAQITEKSKTTPTKTMQKLILVEFKYAELELTTEDRYLNPLGFQVVNYRVDDDNLTQ